MQRIRLLIMALVVVLGVSFSTDNLCTFAAVKKSNSKLSTSKVKSKVASTKAMKTSVKAKGKTTRVKSKKVTPKKVAPKKVTSKKKSAKKSSTKKTTKTSRRSKSKRTKIVRGKVHSRGSGSTLGEGSVVKVINYAKRYLGVNYNFGSSSARAFDCSGFIMYVYRIAGINLPHSAAGQSNLGLAIQNKSNLEPGDLIFFETTRPGISHVGMYIGNDHFIHASSGADEVTITSLSDQYYSSRFRGGTRILND